MSIRFKIIILVLPLLATAAILVGIASYFSAASGINRVTSDFLGFKVFELQKYADSQWQLLIDNNKTDQEAWIQANKGSVEVYARGLIRKPSELIVALGRDGKPGSQTRAVNLGPDEGLQLVAQIKGNQSSIMTVRLEGQDRVGRGFYFAPFDWYYFVSDLSAAFYGDINQIAVRTLIISVLTLALASILLFIFSQRLTQPLRKIVDSMKEIISSADLSKQVEVEYNDETGVLAHTFNIMTNELDKAWKQIKNYALQAVLAQKKEARIRNIFQRYVPQEVINQVETNPEEMLVGRDVDVSTLFSDIRGFTTISEKMHPHDLVQSLNQYFSFMVDLIVNRKGIVDKYIGDAIMAFFGAPVAHDDDALQSVLAGIEMTQQVEVFNRQQIAKGKPPFYIGVGINYGKVTVGNIGTEKKMDYTVIGDNVNLASRLEGLTKEYHQTLLITESLKERVETFVPTRFIDTVAVKGKSLGVRIYTAKDKIDDKEKAAWAWHNEAMELYVGRNFLKARDLFKKVQANLPDDFASTSMLEICQGYIDTPPPEGWNGVRIMDHK